MNSIFKNAPIVKTIIVGAFVSISMNVEAQLYSSGNNSISSNYVGIGTNTPEAYLDVHNRIVPQANCQNCQSFPAQVQPAMVISSEIVANPPNSGTSLSYSWTIDATDEFLLSEQDGNSFDEVFSASADETVFYSTSTFLTPNIQASTNTINGGDNYTLGFGVSCDNGTYHTTQGTSSGTVLRSKGGDLKVFTGVANNAQSPVSRMTIRSNGNIGIGTNTPSHKLEVSNGDMRVYGGDLKVDNGDMRVHGGDMHVHDGDMLVSSGRLVVANTLGRQFEVKSNGYVVAREILVDIDEMIPDYVFDEDYDLMELSDLRNYLDENHHLPNIPSATEFEEQGGIEVGELTRLLLEKQEEMVLYILDLEDRIEMLNQKIN